MSASSTAERGTGELAGEHAAGREVGRAGDAPDEDQRRQQQHDRGAHQQAEIDASAGARGVGACMRDERVGDERQHFVEHEQREQVGGTSDAHRRRDREREADVEARLLRLAVGAHVADRVDRVDDPQPGCDEREQHARAARRETRSRARASRRPVPAPVVRRRGRTAAAKRRNRRAARRLRASRFRAGWVPRRTAKSAARRRAARARRRARVRRHRHQRVPPSNWLAARAAEFSV